MVHNRISFFLGLLFVMHGLICSSAVHAHQDKDGLAVLSGGRKLMVALKEIVREGPNYKVDINGGISKISGDDHMKASNSPRRSQGSLNSQEPAIQETDHEETSEQSASMNDETRRLLEAAKEIVSLMHKDYKGMGRRKPPINNHEPSH